jgi:pilus assembly protein CpaF
VAYSQRFDDSPFSPRPQGDDPGRFGERRYSESGSRHLGESGEYRLNRASGDLVAGRQQIFFDLQHKVQQRLVDEMKSLKIEASQLNSPEAQKQVEQHLRRIIDEEVQRQNIPLSRTEHAAVFDRCLAEITGHGPIEPLIQEPAITEIMINGPTDVWVEKRNAGLVKTNVRFQDEDHILRLIERIVSRVGRRIDESSPMVDARLPDGSRVNAIIRPVAIDGPKVTIRKFRKDAMKPADLIKYGSITEDMMRFLEACVKINLNIIVSGGTNSGKSTLLNVLSAFISNAQRIITIEDSAELQLQQQHVIRLESRPASVEGKNRITIRDLLVNALRMTPNRIIVGECRAGEALDMLQAMNTGHEGSMTTVHANTPRDVLSRLEVLVLQAGVDLPQRAIREQIASAVHLIVHTNHFEDGSRKVAAIAEVRRGANDGVDVENIFEFVPTGVDAKGRLQGQLRATGYYPRALVDRLERAGVHLPPTIFQK